MVNMDTVRYLEERNRRINCAIRNMDKQELLSCFDLYANKNYECTLAVNRYQDKAIKDLDDEHLFDWKRVKDEVKVIQPLFYVRTPKGLKMQAVWAKSCRGAMVRFILQHRILFPEELHAFSYEGFEYQPQLGEEVFPHFVRG